MRDLVGISVGGLLTAAACAAVAQPSGAPLHLTCPGTRTAEVTEVSSVSISRDFDVTHDQTGSTHTQKVLTFPGRADVVVNGNEVRVRLPTAMLPSSMSASDGWVGVSEATIDADKITGRLAYGRFAKPRLRIDRHTGEIDVRASDATFSGTCERSNEALDAQKF